MFKSIFATLLSCFWLFSCFISGFYVTEAHAQQANFHTLKPPIPLPPMIVHDTEGRTTTLKQLLKAKATQGIVLLHLWSPKCGPCIKEMQAIDKAQDSLAAQNMPILSLAQDIHGEHTVPLFIRRYSLQGKNMYIDKQLKAMKALRPSGVPVTYIVSDKGQALAVHEGSMSW